ncbi:MAG: aspartate 4-decarboxylase [Cellulosilyticaceae bacterium]
MSEISKIELRKIYDKVSPFEFKEELIALARTNSEIERLLDAGRGNPNWTAATPRQAFFSLGQFAVLETQKTWQEKDLAGMVKKVGIAKRLGAYLESNPLLPGIDLIKGIVEYGIAELGFDADEWVYELSDGIIGDNYPFPDRSLARIEKVVRNYLLKILGNKTLDKEAFEVFGVEGGAAAMSYLFDSLVQNKLLHKGDKIALMTPIFTPYLEIPHLPNYEFEVVKIQASEKDEKGNMTYQYPKEEMDKLKDTQIKALFVVNPNNPVSVAMNEEGRNYLMQIVKEYHPKLMIVTDDVYGTFVEEFRSLSIDLPYNTLCVYSLSKYFGVTGWRLGAIMLQKKNVFNDLIKELSLDMKEEVNKRYEHLCSIPESISFIDRIVADSRQVALNHTAGLSTPQQVQMALFCAFDLLDEEEQYKKLTMQICKERKQLLYEGLQIDCSYDQLDACYYTEINLLEWACKEGGNQFVDYLESNYSLLDILYELAGEYGIILLKGDGFASSKWGLRISLANLENEDYYKMGQVLRKVFMNLLNQWLNR